MQRSHSWRVLACLSFVGTQIACGASAPRVAEVATPQTNAVATAHVVNASRRTLCAEEDNVYVKLLGDGLTGMRIEARQPTYIGQLERDDSAADFSDCHFAKDENPIYQFEPKRVVLWEDARWVLVGNTYATFWRPNQVPVVVEGKATEQLHLLQLHLKDASEPSAGRHEFLVLYPPDGYWRAKPVPALPLPSSTYGTSFIVGPVTQAKRPVVEITRVEFVPKDLSFKLDFGDGSHGSMRVVSIDRDAAVLRYEQDRPCAPSQPIAAIRSMFVTPAKADVAEVRFRTRDAADARSASIMDFTEGDVTEVLFGRTQISKHNPSAPDMWFGEVTR